MAMRHHSRRMKAIVTRRIMAAQHNMMKSMIDFLEELLPFPETVRIVRASLPVYPWGALPFRADFG